MSMDKNLLFYSKTCKMCYNLLNVLEVEELLKFFNLVCVDDKISYLPPQIKVVPTMIVKNVNKPLVGKETFQWIELMKCIKKYKEQNQDKKIDLRAYIRTEMGFFSDIFSYVNHDNPLEQSFYTLSGSEEAINTVPEYGKINKLEQNKKIKELQIQRTQQEKEIKQNIKK